MNSKAIVTLGLAACAVGCGNEAPVVERRSDDLDWRRVDRDFPFVGERGETVCDEWERTEDGVRIIEREFYHFAVMNEALSGGGTRDAKLVAQLKQAGLERVASCDDARRFLTLERDYLVSQELEEPITPQAGKAEPEGSTPAPDASNVDKVADGKPSTIPFMVRVQPLSGGFLSTCSGFLIGRKTLLTSAHCFSSDGHWDVRVDQGRGQTGSPTASIGCLSGGNSCSNTPSGLNAEVVRFDGFAGPGDTARDLALVINDTDWALRDPNEPGTRAPQFLPITVTRPRQGETYLIDGYGAHAATGSGFGVHRQANQLQGLDARGIGYWRDVVQQGVGRPCAGDSGSAAVNTSLIAGSLFGPNMAIGIAAKGEGVSQTVFCGSPGNFFWYTGIDDKIFFIERELRERGILVSPSVGPCHQRVSGTWHYRACFNL